MQTNRAPVSPLTAVAICLVQFAYLILAIATLNALFFTLFVMAVIWQAAVVGVTLAMSWFMARRAIAGFKQRHHFAATDSRRWSARWWIAPTACIIALALMWHFVVWVFLNPPPSPWLE